MWQTSKKISKVVCAKQIWDTLEKCYDDDGETKKVKLQTLQRQYELLQIDDQEKFVDFISRVRKLANQMATCEKDLYDKKLSEKILRSLHPIFDYIVCTSEESNDT